MQPTRQEMLDAINMKIARTGGGTGPGETGYYLPVMIGDVLAYFLEEKNTPLHADILYIWKTKREPLLAQDDDCISYIFSLISHE